MSILIIKKMTSPTCRKLNNNNYEKKKKKKPGIINKKKKKEKPQKSKIKKKKQKKKKKKNGRYLETIDWSDLPNKHDFFSPGYLNIIQCIY